jgi:hypothetical protein
VAAPAGLATARYVFRLRFLAFVSLRKALHALAAFGINQFIEVFLAVVEGDFLAGLDVPLRPDPNAVAGDIGDGVRPA